MASFLIYELFIDLPFLFLISGLTQRNTPLPSRSLSAWGLKAMPCGVRLLILESLFKAQTQTMSGRCTISVLNFVSACLYHRNSNIAIKDQLRIYGHHSPPVPLQSWDRFLLIIVSLKGESDLTWNPQLPREIISVNMPSAEELRLTWQPFLCVLYTCVFLVTHFISNSALSFTSIH